MKARCLLSLVTLAFLNPQILATSVRALELEDVVGGSYQIFLGRLIAVRQGSIQDFDLTYTEYTFAVSDWIKGGGNQTVSVRQLGRSGGVGLIPGIPSYKKGEEVVLFIHRPSQIGLTSPVGMQQGYYPVERDSGGDRYVRLGAMRSSVERLRSRLKIPVSPSEQLRATDLMLLEDFLSLVRQLR
ncbi:MAG: hypothetical protein HYX74_10545 [Acidobacteria bacterium]|nr:hypothetical protein [Acidobacteriota bacterium]